MTTTIFSLEVARQVLSWLLACQRIQRCTTIYLTFSQSVNDWPASWDDGWTSKKLTPYFRKHQRLDPLEGQSIEDRGFMPFLEELHGNHGPIHTSFNDWQLPFANDLRAGDEMKSRPQDP